MNVLPDADEVIATLQTALIVVNPGGIVERVNAGCEVLLNASAANLVGKGIATIIDVPSGYRVAADTAFAAYDITVNLPFKPAVRADFIATPFPDRAGWQLIALYSRAKAQLIGNRAEGAGTRTAVGVAAMLAHEIKNPISGIRGAAQLLQAGRDESDAKLTQLICTEVDRITRLIDRMEGFTDTRPLVLRSDNIHEIIDHARGVALSGFGHKLTITDTFDPSLPLVLIDRDAMVQIILNLLKNAAETAVPGQPRTIRLTTAYRQGVSVSVDGSTGKRPLPIELCIIDDGDGAPSDIAETIFEPFVSSKKAGRGLGLALVEKLVRDMGGMIQYAREGDPLQTVFRILLPRAHGEQQ